MQGEFQSGPFWLDTMWLNSDFHLQIADVLCIPGAGQKHLCEKREADHAAAEALNECDRV